MGNQIIKLGDYCDIVKGGIGIQKAISGEFPLVVTAEARLSHNEYQFDNTAVIIPLVSSTGHGHASLKRIHYQEGKFALGTILSAVIIRDETILNPRYLYLYLSYFKDHLLVPLMKGAANVTLSIKKIKTVEIPLPSMKRQLEIIELEKNSYLVDNLTTEIQTQKQLLTQLKQSILQEAIQGKLTADWRKQNPNTEPASELLKRIKAEKAQLIKDKKIKKEKALPPITANENLFDLPQGWVWCRLGDIYRFIDYRGKTPTKIDKGVRLITAKNVRAGYYKYSPEEFISKKEYDERMTRGIPKNGDILFTTEAPMGKATLLNLPDEIISTGQRLITFQSPILAYDNRYILNYILSNTFQSILEDKSSGVTATGIKSKRLVLSLVALPPLEEQEAIAEKVEALKQKCQALEQEIKTSEANAQMLMQAVLKEAFEGKQEVGEG